MHTALVSVGCVRVSLGFRGWIISIWLGLLAGPFAFGQGSLTPPGAPSPSMRTMQQIEPRTPIDSVPFVISQPGSYYFTGPLLYIGTGVAIEIAASDVTLDGGGFTLTGNPSSGDHIIQNANGIELLGSGSTVAQNVHGGPGAPITDDSGTNPTAPIQDVTVGVNPLGNIIY